MGRLRDRIRDVVDNVRDVAKDIGGGVKDIGEGAVGMAKSAAKLDFEGVGENAAKISDGVTDIAFTAIENTPIVKAADTLLDGKVSQGLERVEGIVDESAEAAVMSVASSVEGVKDGVVASAKALSEGDFKEAGLQALAVAQGAASLTPMGIASTAGSVFVENVVSKVVPGQLGDKMGAVAGAVVGVANAGEAVTEGGMAILDQTGAGEKLAQAGEKLGLPAEAIEAASRASERGGTAGKREASDRTTDTRGASERGLQDKNTASGGADAESVGADRSRAEPVSKGEGARDIALPAMAESVASDAAVQSPGDSTPEADAAMAMSALVNVVAVEVWPSFVAPAQGPDETNEAQGSGAAGLEGFAMAAPAIDLDLTEPDEIETAETA